MEFLTLTLILVPFLAALIISLIKNNCIRGYFVFIFAALTMVVAFVFMGVWMSGRGNLLLFLVHTHEIDIIMVICELFLMCLITVRCLKNRRPFIALLSIVQTLAMIWMEFFSGVWIAEATHIRVDYLSIIMVLIIAVVGGFITIYAVGYMRGYHEHHKEVEDRSGSFLALLFVFLGAMFGLVLSSVTTWIYFFWEITSVISFLLIGYTRTGEAIRNSFKALWMNLLGGFGFALGIIWFVFTHNSIYLRDLIAAGSRNNAVSIACIALLAFAALTKSAQLPFSPWLAGAMVAPTPSSALLHSATMVKAGVYLLIRLSPGMHGNLAGSMVAIIGGFTFFSMSLLAISTSDGKGVLAYSTISNLGLITACAGMGVPETIWAAIFLVIFHAISKALLFQTVGAIENTTGTRDVEDMHGLFLHLPKLAFFMLIGICGMFLAPFGMLVSKWAALKAFVDEGNIIGTAMVLFVCFGSATTLLYWAKWLGKLVAIYPTTPVKDKTSKAEYTSLFMHMILTLVMCVSFPVLSTTVIQPIINTMFGIVPPTISTGNLMLMVLLLLCVAVFPTILFIISNFIKRQSVIKYMAGVNSGDSRHFIDAQGQKRQLFLSSWYLSDWIGEKKIMPIALTIGTTCVVIMLTVIAGGAL